MSALLGADTDTLDRVAESLRADAQRVQDIRDLAGRAVAELRAGWSGADMVQLTEQWERQASPRLSEAAASLGSCATQLRAQSTAQQEASGVEAGVGVGTGAGVGNGSSMRPAAPPKNGSPTGYASWWSSMKPQQQQQVISDHPDWIGNRDGVSFTARDLANRALIRIGRTGLLVEKQRLQHKVGGNWFGGAFTNDDARLSHVEDKLKALDAIDQTLAGEGERQLLVLDTGPERVEAAIARGNVDTADNVAVFVPGLDANVSDGIRSGDQAMGELQRRAELESKRAGANLSAATVFWIGYQAPQSSVSEILGDDSVLDDHAAKNGAAQLVPFLQGIDAARDHDAHLTLLGHSYGSTTSGVALRQDTGVDDAVFFGSPGLDTSHVGDLLVPAGHTYYIEARNDLVGDLGHFGIDPSHLEGVEHASAGEAAVVDPMTGAIRHFDEVTGHSSYLTDGSTSQYNISVVAAGLPDRRANDAGEGLGDVFSRRTR